MQAVKAYYSEGAFIPFNPVAIPKGSHAIIIVINQDQHVDKPVQDDDFASWQIRMKDALALSMDEELPEAYFIRSKDMRAPIIFDE